jgi:hypothetical protein
MDLDFAEQKNILMADAHWAASLASFRLDFFGRRDRFSGAFFAPPPRLHNQIGDTR